MVVLHLQALHSITEALCAASASQEIMHALNMHVHGGRYVSIRNMCVCYVASVHYACIYGMYVRVIWVQYIVMHYALYNMRYVLCIICYAIYVVIICFEYW
jgi:uncharacterized membrane protein YqgA involved in biofilm formation